MQYKKETTKINAIYSIAIGTNPIANPKFVYGTINPAKIKSPEEMYTHLLALLCKNGIFAVLIICIPIKFETIL